jgi:hypothetical protein
VNIWLLDIDGVLVQAGGYRAATRATVAHFSDRMGLGNLAPTGSDIDVFEAAGMINEWDTVPVCVAVLIYGAWRRDPALLASGDLDRAAQAIRAAGPLGIRPDYQTVAWRMSQARQASEAPSRVVLRLLLDDAQREVGVLAEAEGLARVLQALLEDTSSVRHCPTTFVFQHYSLGSRLFDETFGLAPAFDSDSLLARYDEPGLSAAWRDRLHDLAARGEVRPVVFTARPSGPPRDAVDALGSFDPVQPVSGADRDGGTPPGAYAPEAEIAVKMVGLRDVPLIGYGRIEWLARKLGLEAVSMVKPSPVQALAAIGAAASGREQDSLLAAHTLVAAGRLEGPLLALRGLRWQVSVFEDTFGGMRAVREAVKLLSDSGVDITSATWGVARSVVKANALAEFGAPVFDTLDQAMDAAFKHMGLCE